MRLLGIRAPVWQTESFDHVVRNVEKANDYRRYILENPAKAGLRDWPHVGASELGYDGVVWPFHE